MRRAVAIAVGALTVLVLIGDVPVADAQRRNRIMHRVRAGDTLQLLAAEYYGDRRHAVFIMKANKMSHPAPLRRGRRIAIPVSYTATAQVGDTWENLAKVHLDDERRAEFLATFNGAEASDTIAAGAEISVPFDVPHTAARAVTLRELALAYYRDAKKSALIKQYNFLDQNRLTPGQTILIPIMNVQVRRSKLGKIDAESADRRQRRIEMQKRARMALPLARVNWRAGEYDAVKEALTGVDPDYLDTPDAVETAVLLGATYLAFDDEASALASFRKALERDPDYALSAYKFSPKIVAVWKNKAGGAVDNSRPGDGDPADDNGEDGE